MERFFEIAKLYCDRGDFQKSLSHLKEGCKIALESQDYSNYLKFLNLALRINSELLNEGEVQNIKERLQDLVIRRNLSLTPELCHTLAVCALYRNQMDGARDYWQRVLQMTQTGGSESGLDPHSPQIPSGCQGEVLLNAEFGLIYLNVIKDKDYPKAMSDLDKIEAKLDPIENRELLVSILMLKARILRFQEKFEDSLILLWSTFRIVRNLKNLTLYCQMLDELGLTYLESGNLEQAEIYLKLAEETVDKKNQVRLAKVIQKNMEKLRSVTSQDDYDLILNEDDQTVVDHERGLLDFRNQVILFDFLKLLVLSQGRPLSKEAIAKSLWREGYLSKIHDNKIYVTVKRLRDILEPTGGENKYIFRNKDGYFLNRKLRIQL